MMVPVNTRYRPEEVEYVLNKSKASILVLKEEPNKDYLSLLKELAPGARVAADTIPNERLPHLRKIVVSSQRSLIDCMSFDDLKKLGESVSETTLHQAARKVTSEDIAMIQFTSGTPRCPRGNAVSRRHAAVPTMAARCLSSPKRTVSSVLNLFSRGRFYQGHAWPHRFRLHDDRPALL
jgi:fatty-acyl-CoA synthase